MLSGLSFQANSQELKLLFIGDLMCHDAQLESAMNPKDSSYHFEPWFRKMSPLFSSYDFVIANLEVTLAGEPYKGYPSFSSPDQLVDDAMDAGINVFLTANNHCLDRGRNGLERTHQVLKSKGVPFTGSFSNFRDKMDRNPLILEKNNIRLAILNYTYGTNGNRVEEPNMVNYIDSVHISWDIKTAENLHPDQIIAVMHWGNEYESLPSKKQIQMKEFLNRKGVSVVIGSHPHVIQPMEFNKKSKELTVYSMGNFISNQRTRKRDGGALIGIHLKKEDNQLKIVDKGYYLAWVRKWKEMDAWKYEILPSYLYQTEADLIDAFSKEKWEVFLQDSRKLLKENNKNFKEYTELNE